MLGNSEMLLGIYDFERVVAKIRRRMLKTVETHNLLMVY